MESLQNDKLKPAWSQTVAIPHRPPLKESLNVDAAVIGAGMAGILTAYLLNKQGMNVVVLEARRIASGQTGSTTAKITSQHGMLYADLIKKAGKHRAELYALANEYAIGAYEKIVREENIPCQFKRLPSYLYSTDSGKKEALKKEARAAALLGISADFQESAGLPFHTTGAVRFDNQAQFHPLEFIRFLSHKVTIYEMTEVIKVKKHTLYTDGGTVTAEHIVFASHYPFMNLPGFYFMRLHQDRSYVLGLTGTRRLEGMYYSADKNGLSFRWTEDMLLLGGSSHRTGKNSKGGNYRQLKAAANEYYPGCTISARWSAQDCMSHDNIPFIGRYSLFRPYWYVATGFKKWGMTSSLLSAMIIRDQICGLKNPYEDLFRPQRCLVKASASRWFTDMWESAQGLAKGAFHLPFRKKYLMPGQGGIVRIGLKRYACYEDETGKLHKISARCPHLGCQLEWNPSEKSWDCPCHGSRFDYDGRLIDNPARRGVKGRL